jgi:MFS family permease
MTGAPNRGERLANARLGIAALPSDGRRLLIAQGVRAAGYGLSAVLLGTTLRDLDLPAAQVGLVLAAVVAGTVLASIAVGAYADRVGRRRCYQALWILLALGGVVFGLTDRVVLLALVALTGALSTEVVESGPFTTLEQAMLATAVPDQRPLVRGFGLYNAVAALAGSLGALSATIPGLLRGAGVSAAPDQRYFLLLVPAALAGWCLARRLTAEVEAPAHSTDATGATAPWRRRLDRSRPVVLRLAGLFAVDSLGGGFVVQSFIAYWLGVRYGASTASIGIVFAAVGVLQTTSFLLAPLLAERIGLLATMVGTHLPSNLLLAAVPFAPTLRVAVGLLFARTLLSQMDVPTRQAYVMILVDPAERSAAAAVTNTARYLTRPLGPALSATAQTLSLVAPFVAAGTIKIAYDLSLWAWFRRIPLPADSAGAQTRPLPIAPQLHVEKEAP